MLESLDNDDIVVVQSVMQLIRYMNEGSFEDFFYVYVYLITNLHVHFILGQIFRVAHVINVMPIRCIQIIGHLYNFSDDMQGFALEANMIIVLTLL